METLTGLEAATFAAMFGRHERRYVPGEVAVDQASQGPRLTLKIPYNVESAPLSSRDLGDFVEVIRPSAFTKSLQEHRGSIVALWQHDPSWVLGRLSNGTMETQSTPAGLVARVQLDGEDPMHRSFARRVERRDVTGASFGFTAIRAPVTRRSDGSRLRELIEVQLEDISAVTYPAYEASEAEARALLLLAGAGCSRDDCLRQFRERRLDRLTARHGLNSVEARRRRLDACTRRLDAGLHAAAEHNRLARMLLRLGVV